MQIFAKTKIFSISTLFFTIALASTVRADPPAMLGGGNISIKGDPDKFEVLKTLGAGMCRIPVSPGDYWNGEKATPEKADAGILMAHTYGVRPVLLFEYYTRWNDALGGNEKWSKIGRAYAERFRPNSPWLISQGVRDWGIVFYTAINEPMWKENNPQPIPVADYVAAIEGLADGVHAIDPALKVSPGGFQEVPLFQQKNRYIKALAPLYNQKKLHAIDIHRYWDIEYVPMRDGYKFSLQNQFDEVKRYAGITENPRFQTTEMNFKKRKISEEEAAAGFLTALWDALTVVDSSGGGGATEFVLPWNIFHAETRDEHYGLCKKTIPWTPNARGAVLREVCRLTRDMEIISRDPKRTGITVLESATGKMWVWQNRQGWSSVHGDSIQLTELPEGSTVIEIHGWDGLHISVNVSGRSEITITGLKPDQTWMFCSSGRSQER